MSEHKRQDPFKVFSNLLRSSLELSVLFLVVPLGYLILLLCINVNPNADTAEIYVRNISSIVAIIIAGLFFRFFMKAHQLSNLRNIKLLKLATMFMGLASIAKVIISLFYLVRCIISGNIILLFYVGEILIWSALATFAYAYYQRITN